MGFPDDFIKDFKDFVGYNYVMGDEANLFSEPEDDEDYDDDEDYEEEDDDDF